MKLFSRTKQATSTFWKAVFDELLKPSTTSNGEYRLLYYRDADRLEVDIVIENSKGKLIGVKVKTSATVKERDLRRLRKLASLAGDHFTAGVLLYDGDQTLPLGDDNWTAPPVHTLGFLKL